MACVCVCVCVFVWENMWCVCECVHARKPAAKYRDHSAVIFVTVIVDGMCVRVCVRECVRVCVRACLRVCVCAGDVLCGGVPLAVYKSPLVCQADRRMTYSY